MAGTLEVGVDTGILIGNGKYEMSGGALAAVNIAVNRTFEQSGGAVAAYERLRVGSATGQAIGLAAIYDLNDGVLNAFSVTNLDNIHVNGGAFNLTGPEFIGGGRTDIGPAGTLDVQSDSMANIALQAINNGGVIRLTGAGGLDITGGGAIQTNNGGTFDVQTDVGVMSSTGDGIFNINSGGTLLKSAGTGATTFTVNVTSSSGGRISGQSGTLSLAGGGTNAGEINSGAAGAVALAGNWALNSGTSFTGTGVTQLNGAITMNRPRPGRDAFAGRRRHRCRAHDK